MSYVSLLNQNLFSGDINTSSLIIDGTLDLTNANIIGLADNVTTQIINNPNTNVANNVLQVKDGGITNQKIVTMDSNKLTGNISVAGGYVKLLLPLNMNDNDINNVSDIIPYSDETAHLGSILNKFANIYSRDGYFTGSINVHVIDNSLGVVISYNGTPIIQTTLSGLSVLSNMLLSGSLASSGNIYPMLDTTYNLGININRWLTTYTKNIDSSDGINIKYNNTTQLTIGNNNVSVSGTLITPAITLNGTDLNTRLVTDENNITTLQNKTQYQSASGNNTTFTGSLTSTGSIYVNNKILTTDTTNHLLYIYDNAYTTPNLGNNCFRFSGFPSGNTATITAMDASGVYKNALNIDAYPLNIYNNGTQIMQFTANGFYMNKGQITANPLQLQYNGVTKIQTSNTGATISGTLTTDNLITNSLTGYLYGNGTSAISASSTIPESAITGLSTDLTNLQNKTQYQSASANITTFTGTTKVSTFYLGDTTNNWTYRYVNGDHFVDYYNSSGTYTGNAYKITGYSGNIQYTLNINVPNISVSTLLTTPTINNSTSVSLQYNSSTKLSTTNTGISITGSIISSGSISSGTNAMSCGALSCSSINSSGNIITGLTGYLYGNGTSAVTSSTSIPESAITNLTTDLTNLQNKTQYQTVPSANNTTFSGTLNTDTIINTNTITTSAINNALGFSLQYNSNNKILITNTGATINGTLLNQTMNFSSGVQLQYNSSTKLQTTNNGVSVTGSISGGDISCTSLTSSGTISCGVNSMTCGSLSCGAITSTGNFNNGTNSMTSASISCTSLTASSSVTTPTITNANKYSTWY